MKKILLLIIITLISISCYAEQYTDNYRFLIPGKGDRDWHETLSNDIMSIDSLLKSMSNDSTWINDSILSYIYLRNSAYNVGVGLSTPLVKLHVNGEISGDALKFKTAIGVSPDVTAGCPALYVSRDAAQTSSQLLFYDGYNWHKVTVE